VLCKLSGFFPFWS